MTLRSPLVMYHSLGFSPSAHVRCADNLRWLLIILRCDNCSRINHGIRLDTSVKLLTLLHNLAQMIVCIQPIQSFVSDELGKLLVIFGSAWYLDSRALRLLLFYCILIRHGAHAAG